MKTSGLLALLSLLAAIPCPAQTSGDPKLEPSLPIQAGCKDPVMLNRFSQLNSCPQAWTNDPRLSPAVKAQRDEIYTLLAFAIVNSDWQVSPEEARANPLLSVQARRGHNIGGVLVDPSGLPVWWERNHNYIECNNMNHGETRMIFSYLNFKRSGSLGCHSVYTTLEPCAMCSGVMTQQNINRTMYGQQDHDFGAALERLHASFPAREMTCSYPQAPLSIPALGLSPAMNSIFNELDERFHKFMAAHPKGLLIEYLASPEAHEIFQRAQSRFLSFSVETRILPENMFIYQAARALFDQEISKINFPMSLEMHVSMARRRANRTRATQGELNFMRSEFKKDPFCRGTTLGEPLIPTTGAGATKP